MIMAKNFIILKQQISNLPYSLEAKSLKNYMNFLDI